MYSIVLTDGKIININATAPQLDEKTRIVRFFNGRKLVAEINMDNMVGWIDTDYKVGTDDSWRRNFIRRKYEQAD